MIHRRQAVLLAKSIKKTTEKHRKNKKTEKHRKKQRNKYREYGTVRATNNNKKTKKTKNTEKNKKISTESMVRATNNNKKNENKNFCQCRLVCCCHWLLLFGSPPSGTFWLARFSNWNDTYCRSPYWPR
jgi:hypothetical protein